MLTDSRPVIAANRKRKNREKMRIVIKNGTKLQLNGRDATESQVRSQRSVFRNAECGMRNADCGARRWKMSEIRDPRSEIRDQRSEIRDQRSELGARS